MVLLVVFGILAIFFTVIMVDTTKSQEGNSKVFLWCMPVQFFTIVFVLICVLAPTKYGEVKLVDEYELQSFVVDSSDDVYVIFDKGIYFCCLRDNTNKLVPYESDEVTSITYIDEGEVPKICYYVQEREWTWYSAPMGLDKSSYELYIPETGILYASSQN